MRSCPTNIGVVLCSLNSRLFDSGKTHLLGKKKVPLTFRKDVASFNVRFLSDFIDLMKILYKRLRSKTKGFGSLSPNKDLKM